MTATPVIRHAGEGERRWFFGGGFLAARLPPGPTSVMAEPGWCVLHQSLASARDLNRIGSTSGPVTTKSPLIILMVSVVISATSLLPLRALPQAHSGSWI